MNGNSLQYFIQIQLSYRFHLQPLSEAQYRWSAVDESSVLSIAMGRFAMDWAAIARHESVRPAAIFVVPFSKSSSHRVMSLAGRSITLTVAVGAILCRAVIHWGAALRYCSASDGHPSDQRSGCGAP
jgi:hypothetical protein